MHDQVKKLSSFAFKATFAIQSKIKKNCAGYRVRERDICLPNLQRKGGEIRSKAKFIRKSLIGVVVNKVHRVIEWGSSSNKIVQLFVLFVSDISRDSRNFNYAILTPGD